MRVVVTGSRAWQDRSAVFRALTRLWADHGPFTLVHGACSTGADFMAHEWYDLLGRHEGCYEVQFHADWDGLGKGAGPERNERMISAGADLVLAFPLPGGSGTQHTVRLAEAAGIPVRILSHEQTPHRQNPRDNAAVTQEPRLPRGL